MKIAIKSKAQHRRSAISVARTGWLASQDAEQGQEREPEGTASGCLISDEAVRHYRNYFSSLRNGSSIPISDVMDALLHDGYLTARPGGGYRFVFGLLEGWRRARHGGCFVPVYKR